VQRRIRAAGRSLQHDLQRDTGRQGLHEKFERNVRRQIHHHHDVLLCASASPLKISAVPARLHAQHSQHMRMPAHHTVQGSRPASVADGLRRTVVSADFAVKGSLGTFIGLGQLPYYREMGVPAAQYQIYGSIATTPWSMKALWGTLSDSLPIFGYPKGGYIVVLSCVGVASFAVLASVEIDLPQAQIAAMMFFSANVMVSMVDLLCQGAYAAAMVAHPSTSSALVSWVWGQYHVGALMASTLVGPLADAVNPRIIFWIALPLAAQMIIPTCLGYLGEERLPRGQRCCHVEKEKVKSQPRLFFLAVVMAVAALGMASVNLWGTQLMQSIYALSASICLCTLAFFCLGPTLAKANLYMFLTNALYVSTDGALDYFYTADEDCVPGGPQFSYTYYVTWANVVGSCCAIAGVAIFQRTMSDWNFRPVFWVTTVVKVCAAMIDIVIVNRWNIAIGIPDEVRAKRSF
jgi:hypothetical protein